MPKVAGARDGVSACSWKQSSMPSTAEVFSNPVAARQSSLKASVRLAQRVNVGRPRVWQLLQLPVEPTAALPIKVNASRPSSASVRLMGSRSGGGFQSPAPDEPLAPAFG